MMSTRSGKRIHKSLHENPPDEQTDSELTIERKTRSRRLKENCETLNVSLPKARRRPNYVSYPSTDEPSVVPAASGSKPARAAKKNALKEVNTVTETKPASGVTAEPAARQTRRTKILPENIAENITPDSNDSDKPVNSSREGKKSKRNKKKKHSLEAIEKENDSEQGQAPEKKSRKKKEGQKRLNSMIIEDVDFKSLDTSTDSYHSAVGSPVCKQRDTTLKGEVKNLNGTFDITPKVDQGTNLFNVTLEMVSKKLSASAKHSGSANKRKSRTSEAPVPKDTTFDKTLVAADTTFDKNDEIHEAQIIADTTFEKETGNKRRSNANSSKTENFNGTFDKSPRNKINSTVKPLDTTFDKSDSSSEPGNKTINTNFENKSLKVDSKSSLISSDATDGTINVTFDKSDSKDDMCVDITSDESKSENILNTTPLLIESSMETSDISAATPVEKQKPSLKVTAPTPLRREGTFTRSSEKNQAITAPITPLKREGTFTKDGPDVIIMSPKPKQTTPTTPTRRKSLPSPGCTPFSKNRKEKSVLNVTHSLEKNRRSSVSEPVRTRLTRVMFCSPMDNPVLNGQLKSKVIKSSMKGSNKSFLFEEKSSGGSGRPGARKRSYTASDAEEGRAKRTRLVDELQESVDRLSRPRTPQTQAKPEQVTPSKKPPTPKAKSETKSGRRLPDFAALHQRRFEKMESLDECQERKAKRARQLLAPAGGLSVLERSSPRGTTTPAVPPKPTTKEMEPKKPQTKTKPVEPPKFKPDQTRYTRYGFKLNTDVPNAFNIPDRSKNTEKPQETKPNRQLRSLPVNPFTVTTKKDTTRSKKESIPNPFSIPKKSEDKVNKPLLKRQPTLPSLNGNTLRKEVAKQVIMREKSATSLREKRDMSRYENRTIIRGVRTNRRFELQMQSRNING